MNTLTTKLDQVQKDYGYPNLRNQGATWLRHLNKIRSYLIILQSQSSLDITFAIEKVEEVLKEATDAFHNGPITKEDEMKDNAGECVIYLTNQGNVLGFNKTMKRRSSILVGAPLYLYSDATQWSNLLGEKIKEFGQELQTDISTL